MAQTAAQKAAEKLREQQGAGSGAATEDKDPLVWVFYPPKEEREKNNDGTPGKVILDANGRFPKIETKEPRQVPRSRVPQAKSQGWYEDPNALTYLYHKDKKPKVVKASEVAKYLDEGWTTNPADHGKRYEADDNGKIIKAKGEYPDMTTLIEDEKE